MILKAGQLVKLKDYAGLNSKKGQYAYVSEMDTEDVSHLSVPIRLVWVKDGMAFTQDLLNIIKVRTHKINVFAETTKFKVGDIVITNGDGTKVTDSWIYGEIGEIVEVTEESEKGKAIFLWNNRRDGSSSSKQIPDKWKYSWVIYEKNTKGQIFLIERINMDDEIECSACHETLLRSDATKGPDDEWYCETCFGEHFIKCDECGSYIEEDEVCHNENGDSYCQECYDDLYICCEHCSEEIAKDDAFRGADDNYYCTECFHDRFVRCSSCDNIIWQEDAIYLEEDDEYICGGCHNHQKSKIIHDYGYRPDAVFNNLKWEKSVYMGVELEVQEADGEVTDGADALDKFLKKEGFNKYFYLKHDSSVDEGFEIVTHPFTLQYAHHSIGFRKILSWLQKNNFTSEESGVCGLHIHVGRDFFEDLDITKLRLFIKQNKDFLRKLSRREDEHYCEFETTSVKGIMQEQQLEGRYWALNLNSSRETIEFRLFRGTLDETRFIAILQFVDAVCNFVKDVGVASLVIGEGKYKDNSWKLFIDWCKDETKYGTMLNYFTKEKICA